MAQTITGNLAATAIAANRQIKGKLEINWNKDKITYTDESARLISLSLLTMDLNMPYKGGQQEPFKANFLLSNDDDRYSPFNSSSPIYSNIRYNKGHGIPVRFYIGIYDNSTAQWDYMIQFTGYIDEMDCATRQNECTLQCIDEAHRQLQCKVSTTMYQNQTVHEFLDVLCGEDLANIQ